ncbi:uncharacterized protein I303_106684 [Kwoniella dejecticola CBS 10117]|uniref:Uncharacterized protein n=1 Tax=Kwoniella dejecticola CBS 10117 TaxID=1296121 RepID=A0A1A5ZTZ7_9TREE|nr:uncharacterized protein I303_08673 [Kwoniella dejecticola CBS 10117]OBR81287.1 hypothetical protein I303_08673 [Kwoniella dejecticola CBS 10117]
MSNQFPKYADPPSSAPASTSNPASEGNNLRFKIDIQSLSLGCTIPPGSNLGLQLGVPPRPNTSSQSQPRHQTNQQQYPQNPQTASNPIHDQCPVAPDSSSSTPSNPSSSSNRDTNTAQSHPPFPQRQNANPPPNPNPNLNPNPNPDATFGIGPETLLLGLATSFIQRLERVERDLADERRLNAEYRGMIDEMKNKVDSLQNPHGLKQGAQRVDDDAGLTASGGGRRSKGKSKDEREEAETGQRSPLLVPSQGTFNLKPPSQTPVPASLTDRSTPQMYHVTEDRQYDTRKDQLESEDIDEDDEWRRDKAESERTTGQIQTANQPHPLPAAEDGGEDEDEDDPSGLGLDDDQAILYGFKPRYRS